MARNNIESQCAVVECRVVDVLLLIVRYVPALCHANTGATDTASSQCSVNLSRCF